MSPSKWSVIPFALSVLLSGCGSGEREYDRVATFPVKGQLTVDGKPEGQVLIKLHPVGKPATVVTSSNFTNPDGTFTIGTYEGQDGAPVGEYKLTFMWGQINLMSGRYGGPDKLQKRYTDPEKSEFSVSVKEGVESDLGTIALTTK